MYSSANKCLLKVASYSAQLEQYQKAIEIYEQVCHLFISRTLHNACLSEGPRVTLEFPYVSVNRLEPTPWTIPC